MNRTMKLEDGSCRRVFSNCREKKKDDRWLNNGQFHSVVPRSGSSIHSFHHPSNFHSNQHILSMASISFHLLLALILAIVANYFPAQCFLIVPKNESIVIHEPNTVAPPQQQHPPPHQNVTCNITAMLMEMTNPATTPINLPSSKTIGKRSCCCCCCKPCCCCCCPCKCCSCCNPCCCNCCGECTCIKWAPCCCCPCCCGCTGYGRRRMMKFRRNAEISRYSEKRKTRGTNDGGEIV